MGMLAAGVILAIMILPIISAITREVITAVPQHQREAALALGATQWEMMRIAVLRNARAGNLWSSDSWPGPRAGRNHGSHHGDWQPTGNCKSLFAPGYTMASVIANEFTEATGATYSALVEMGLVLFLLTIIVNALAGLLVWCVTRGKPARAIVLRFFTKSDSSRIAAHQSVAALMDHLMTARVLT